MIQVQFLDFYTDTISSFKLKLNFTVLLHLSICLCDLAAPRSPTHQPIFCAVLHPWMSLSRSNGRPEPEVIVNVRINNPSCVLCSEISTKFNDGFAYSKAKMEAAFRPGGILDRDNLPVKPKDARPNFKREDVDLVVCGSKAISTHSITLRI